MKKLGVFLCYHNFWKFKENSIGKFCLYDTSLQYLKNYLQLQLKHVWSANHKLQIINFYLRNRVTFSKLYINKTTENLNLLEQSLP